MSQGRQRGYKAYFCVTGFDSPDEVTSVAGVPPTHCWRVGEPMPLRRGVRRDSAWILEADVGYGAALEERLDTLVSRLEQLSEPISRIRERHSVGINIVALKETNPGFHLSTELLARGSRLALSLDFDLYCLEDGSH